MFRAGYSIRLFGRLFMEDGARPLCLLRRERLCPTVFVLRVLFSWLVSTISDRKLSWDSDGLLVSIPLARRADELLELLRFGGVDL